MDFDSLVGMMDNTLVAAFQKVDPTAGILPVTIHPQDGSADVTISCIVKNPVMEEDYMPGSTQGTAMLMLFIPASAGVVALRGDTASYNGVDYDVAQSDADRCGGVHLKMRGRTQPWSV
jgi:hypothetical protein